MSNFSTRSKEQKLRVLYEYSPLINAVIPPKDLSNLSELLRSVQDVYFQSISEIGFDNVVNILSWLIQEGAFTSKTTAKNLLGSGIQEHLLPNGRGDNARWHVPVEIQRPILAKLLEIVKDAAYQHMLKTAPGTARTPIEALQKTTASLKTINREFTRLPSLNNALRKGESFEASSIERLFLIAQQFTNRFGGTPNQKFLARTHGRLAAFNTTMKSTKIVMDAMRKGDHTSIPGFNGGNTAKSCLAAIVTPLVADLEKIMAQDASDIEIPGGRTIEERVKYVETDIRNRLTREFADPREFGLNSEVEKEVSVGSGQRKKHRGLRGSGGSRRKRAERNKGNSDQNSASIQVQNKGSQNSKENQPYGSGAMTNYNTGFGHQTGASASYVGPSNSGGSGHSEKQTLQVSNFYGYSQSETVSKYGIGSNYGTRPSYGAGPFDFAGHAFAAQGYAEFAPNPGAGSNFNSSVAPSFSANPGLGITPNISANPSFGVNFNSGAGPTFGANPNFGVASSLGTNPGADINHGFGVTPGFGAGVAYDTVPAANPNIGGYNQYYQQQNLQGSRAYYPEAPTYGSSLQFGGTQHQAYQPETEPEGDGMKGKVGRVEDEGEERKRKKIKIEGSDYCF